MASPTSSPPSPEALAVVEARPLTTVDADTRAGTVEAKMSTGTAADGTKLAQIDLVNVEARSTQFSDGTRIRSITRTEQRIEVEAPAGNTVTIAQVAEHAPVLNIIGESATARLLKLDNDDDYTDDDFDDDDDDDDDDDVDLDDDGEPIVAPARMLPAAAAPLPTSTSWSPPFTTIRRGNLTVTVPDINAIVAQLAELCSNTQRHRQVARDALKLLEPLAQRAMEASYGRTDRAALAQLRDEARALAAEPLRLAAAAAASASADLDHGQRISQRATGSPRVKEKLDALIAAATEASEASREASRLLRALEEAAGLPRAVAASTIERTRARQEAPGGATGPTQRWLGVTRACGRAADGDSRSKRRRSRGEGTRVGRL